VLRDVPPAERCRCREAKAQQQSTQAPEGARRWFRWPL
jgi:hypothetical protein